MLISDEYKKINQDLHARMGYYGAGGGKWKTAIEENFPRMTLLDYGCGKGMLGRAVKYPMTEYDPGIPGKDSLPEPHDVVISTDVLEHIEPEHIDAVLDHIQSLAKKFVFLVIATRPARKTLPDGRNAHLIIEPWEWWEEKLEARFEILSVNPDASQVGEFAVIARIRGPD